MIKYGVTTIIGSKIHYVMQRQIEAADYSVSPLQLREKRKVFTNSQSVAVHTR